MRDGGRVLLAQALSTVIVYDPRSHGWGVGAPTPRRFYPSFLRPWMGAQKKGARSFSTGSGLLLKTQLLTSPRFSEAGSAATQPSTPDSYDL